MLVNRQPPVTFMEATSQTPSTKGTSTPVLYPSSTNAGDLLLAATTNCGAVNYASGAMSGAGFTQLGTSIDSASDIGLGVFWKIANGTENGTVVNVAVNNASPTATTHMGVMLRYAASNTIRANTTKASTATATTSPAPTAMSGVLGTDLSILFYAAGNATSGSTSFTLTTPSGWTSRSLTYNNTPTTKTYSPGLNVVELLGSSATPTVTCSVSAGWVVVAVSLVNAPAANDVMEQNHAVMTSSHFW